MFAQEAANRWVVVAGAQVVGLAGFRTNSTTQMLLGIMDKADRVPKKQFSCLLLPSLDFPSRNPDRWNVSMWLVEENMAEDSIEYPFSTFLQSHRLHAPPLPPLPNEEVSLDDDFGRCQVNRCTKNVGNVDKEASPEAYDYPGRLKQRGHVKRYGPSGSDQERYWESDEEHHCMIRARSAAWLGQANL